jgi:hypothetical protein
VVLLADGFLQEYPWLPEVAVGIAASAIPLLITWLWRRKDRQTKTFDYEIIDDVPVFSGYARPKDEVVPVFVDFEVAVPHLRPAWW